MSVADTENVDPVSLDPCVTSFPPGMLVGERYAIVSQLGRGGSCDVYRASDRLLMRDVALKILRTDRVSSHSLARLRREVALAQQIQSPHVVRIHDLGASDGITFITMELVDGETLASLLARSPMPVDEVVRIASEVLRGLVAIHERGVVHRDIKPSNILIDAEGAAKVGDLGLARQFDTDEPKLTCTEALVGTLPYISPEQALGIQPDGRSDLYSLGATIYECLTGQLPFERGTAVATLASHISEKAPAPRTLRPDVPRWLDAFVRRLLEKEPRNRFQSAAEALRSLGRQRVPVRWRKAFSPLALLAALALTGVAAWSALRPGACASLIPAEKGFRAVDAQGRTLWSYDGALPSNAWLLNAGTKRAVVATIPGSEFPMRTAGRSRLLLLDPATGRQIREIPLPTTDLQFPDFDDRFGATAGRVDLDHDGAEELLIGFVHTYWPWYTVLVDPGRATAQLLYVSTGHQSVLTTADLNGDGRDEVIFAGRDNLMGWYASLAAIDVGTSNRDREFLPGAAAGCSPMVERNGMCVEGRVLWHTLLRRSWPERLDVDGTSKTIRVTFDSGPVETVRFDGRLVQSEVRAATAMERRAAAIRLLRAAAFLERGTRYGDARDDALAASHEAAGSGDPYLAEWTQRVVAKLTILAGDPAGGEALARGLMARSDAAADIAYDVGRALYLHGDYRAAARNFQEGLYNDHDVASGRLKYEFVEGGVFALVAAGDIEAADALVLRTPDLLQAAVLRSAFHAAIRFLAGRDFVPPQLEATSGSTDLQRYWTLEFDWRRTRDAAAVLAGVEAEIRRDGSLDGLLQSLEAELLEASGRRSDAAEAARSAMLWVERSRATDMIASAHEKIVRERYERIAGAGR